VAAAVTVDQSKSPDDFIVLLGEPDAVSVGLAELDVVAVPLGLAEGLVNRVPVGAGTGTVGSPARSTGADNA
jgi:hypothetical protein